LLGEPVAANFAGMSNSLELSEAGRIAAGKESGSGQELNAEEVTSIQSKMTALEKPVVSMASANCAALPAGHHRRVFFGTPASNPDGFGLGYEEVDANGEPVLGTFQDVAAFDPTKVSVCLPLGAGNTPVTEEWELVNVAGELHNFHMHQTKFYVYSEDAPAGDGGAMMDNVPLPTGGAACDGTVAAWRSGECKVPLVRVRIPFAEVGDFVYHCHIGEHQDGGMMAHIRVIAQP
jgi:L-ascorbate oxidase